MRYVLHAIPYAHRDLKAVGPVNPLIVGRASAMFETAENRGGLGGLGYRPSRNERRGAQLSADRQEEQS